MIAFILQQGNTLKMSSYHQDTSFFLVQEYFMLERLWSTDLGSKQFLI